LRGGEEEKEREGRKNTITIFWDSLSLFFFFKCKAEEFIEIEKGKVGKKSPQSWGVPKRGVLRDEVIWGFYAFSPGHCSIAMLIRCAESSILVGCSCNILIGLS
jgi:hypothetical protein